MIRRIRLAAVCVLLLAPFNSRAKAADAAAPFLHPLFASGMVLQREVPDPVWGWTEAGKQVTVSMSGKSWTAVAGADGKWMVKIGPFAAGGPYELNVSGPKEVKLTNVMVGDVWICSGQSNMEMGIGGANNGAQEIAQADHPMLRLFTVGKHVAFQPQTLFADKGEENKWLVCTPATITVGDWNGFSAAGYFFGRELQEKLKIPIGLIHTSWGGTVAEAWTSAEALDTMPDFAAPLQAVRNTVEAKPTEPLEQQIARWYARVDPGSAKSPGWEAADLPVSDWKTMTLPTHWEDAGIGMNDFDGIVWFRREVELPADWIGEPLVLHLGAIDDRDTTWVNGTRVGGKDLYQEQRDYKIAADLTKSGKLSIAVRVLDTGFKGGMYGPAQNMRLERAEQAAGPISLTGDWKYKIAISLRESGSPPQQVSNNPNLPTVLYNGMVAPLVPFAIKGAIWYQGESNADRATQYRTLLPTMIKDWRHRFGVGEFPFFIVQIAAFMPESDQPMDAPWPQLREAQTLTAATVGASAIAVATDIGDAKDIHPKNKQEVGHRLALDAEAIAYGQNIEYAGPTFERMEIKKNQIVLHFSHLGGGLEARGGAALKGFAIAGQDKKFVWADATIDGDSVVVSAPTVADPVAARYAWENNPAKANLYNKAGLPAGPFRTDMPK